MSKIPSYKNPTIYDFFRELYKPILDENGNIKENEKIKIEKYQNRILKKEEFYSNINELCKNVETQNKYYYDTYFSLTTNNGNSKSMNDSKTRTCIAFDFDKKDNEELTATDLIHKFSNIGLFYHCIIDSGHGFHVYIFINKTNNLQLVSQVTKHITTLLEADTNCTTQILRVPFTTNCKEEKNKKRVNIIKLYKDIRRKNIEDLAKRYIMKYNENKNIEYLLREQIPKCLANIITTGTTIGNRNKDLQKIVVLLKGMKKSEAEILAITKEWNNNNKISFNQNELEYQVNYMYNNLNTTELECNNCKYNNACYSKVMTDFKYEENEKLIKLSENSVNKSKNKKSKRKGVRKMNGNMLLVYSVLKNHFDGLYKEELEKELTYKSKRKKIERVALSNPTLIKTLKELEENKFITIETINRKKLYKCIPERVKEECTFVISYSATYECIKGNISTEEYELYCYMRYLHNKEQRENPRALKGNLFRINQEDLAKDLNVTQQRISAMISNLIDEKLLSIWYRGKKENSNFYYNVYLLNY